MTIRIDGPDVVLTSGRRIPTVGRLLSVGQDDSGTWEMMYGFDGYVRLTEWAGPVDDDNRPEYSRADLTEIAEYFIARWQAFRQAVLDGVVPTLAESKP